MKQAVLAFPVKEIASTKVEKKGKNAKNAKTKGKKKESEKPTEKAEEEKEKSGFDPSTLPMPVII